MEYVEIEVYCIACKEKIDSPADCIMDSFRLGIPIHKRCADIVDNFLKAWKTSFGAEYYVAWEEAGINRHG